MTYRFITTFGQRQYELYGKQMVESWRANVKNPDVELVVYTDEDLNTQPEFKAFWDAYSDKYWANGVLKLDTSTEKQVADYRYQAVRFAWKVFAYTDPKLTEDLSDYDWLIWLDADTRITGEFDEDWLHKACPGGFMGSYIGRKMPDWDHSECGWIAYSMRYHARQNLADMRAFYTTGLLFGLNQWHDSYVWDRVKQKGELEHGSRWFNLARGVGGSHPWPKTVLGERIEHFKGPQLKKQEFGAVA
jgi:hypothetical protein